MTETLFFIIGLLVGVIGGAYFSAKEFVRQFTVWSKAHEGERIHGQLPLDVFAPREKGDFIIPNIAESYMKEHAGEDIRLADILKDDDDI